MWVMLSPTWGGFQITLLVSKYAEELLSLVNKEELPSASWLLYFVLPSVGLGAWSD